MTLYHFSVQLNNVTGQQGAMIPLRLGNCRVINLGAGNYKLFFKREAETYKKALYIVRLQLWRLGIKYTEPTRIMTL